MPLVAVFEFGDESEVTGSPREDEPPEARPLTHKGQRSGKCPEGLANRKVSGNHDGCRVISVSLFLVPCKPCRSWWALGGWGEGPSNGGNFI